MKIPPSTHSPNKPRRTRQSQPHWRQASLGLILALLTTGSSFAVTKTWNNTSGNTDWNTASFWTATGVPGSGDIVQFTGAAVASPNISASTTITTLISDATASGYTLSANSGQSLTLLSAGSGGASVINFQNTTGTNTISANLILGQAAAATATFNQTIGGTLVFSGDISSTNAIAGLYLVAQGSTTLSGNNTYSGITTLIGTLNINSATAISSGSLLAQANVVLANTSGAAITLTNNNHITLNSTLTLTSAATTGDLNFGSGVATVSGGGRTILVTNDGSTLKIGSLDADTTARTLTIGTSATAPTATFGKLSIANAAGANLQGTINFAGGVLEIGNKSALGTGTILWMTDHNSLGVKTFQASTDLTGANAVANPMQLADNGNNLGPAIIGGTHAIEFSGTLTPNGNARTLTINNTALTTFSGDVKLPTIGVFTFTINGSGNTLISGAISPFTGSTSAGLTYAGTGKLTLSNSGNTYSGATTVNSGTIAYGANQATPSASATVINATAASGTATFDLAGYDSTINSLTFGGTNAGANATNTLSTGTGTLTLGGNVTYTKATLNANDPGTATLSGNLALGATRTFAIADSTNTTNELNLTAAISGLTFGITKTGTGTLTLSGANTYSGVTTVSAGTLNFAKQSALYNGTTSSWTTANLSVAGAAVLALGVGDSASGYFDATALDTLRNASHLGASTTTVGFKSNAIFGIDTTNATSGTFTYNSNLGNLGTSAGNGLAKLGSGTLELGGTNTYTGATTVTAGTLLINGSGTINSTSSIAINASTAKLNYQSSTALNRTVTVTNGGTFAYNSNANYSGTLTLTNGKLGGSNWNGNLANLTIGTNQTIAPGNSPGTATTTTQTWADGGSYDWEINRATGGTAGTDPGWDLLNLTTSLDITATTGIRFTINVISLTLSNVSGAAAGFNSATDYQWMIADSASTITSFSADKFALNLSAFANPSNGAFAIARGDEFGVGGDATQLYLTYTAAVPEPSSFALLAAGLAALLTLRRRLRAD